MPPKKRKNFVIRKGRGKRRKNPPIDNMTETLTAMAPSVVHNGNVSEDSESDSINLDLHISDTDSEKKSLPPAENEDDILNKFSEEEATAKLNGNSDLKDIETELLNLSDEDVREETQRSAVKDMEVNGNIRETEQRVNECKENGADNKRELNDSCSDKSEEKIAKSDNVEESDSTINNKNDKDNNVGKDDKTLNGCGTIEQTIENITDANKRGETKSQESGTNEQHKNNDCTEAASTNETKCVQNKDINTENDLTDDSGVQNDDSRIQNDGPSIQNDNSAIQNKNSSIKIGNLTTDDNSIIKNDDGHSTVDNDTSTVGNDNSTIQNDKSTTQNDDSTIRNDKVALKNKKLTGVESENTLSSIETNKNAMETETAATQNDEAKPDASDDDQDLLQVMETTFDDEFEEKDERSSTTSDKDSDDVKEDSAQEEEAKDDESSTMVAQEEPPMDIEENVIQVDNGRLGDDVAGGGEANGQAEKEAQESETIENNTGEDDNLIADDSHADANTEECPMDIEEENIGSIIVTENRRVVETGENNMEVVDSDSNKENENLPTDEQKTSKSNKEVTNEESITLIDDDIVEVASELKPDAGKRAKRQRQTDKTPDNSKRIKLDDSTVEDKKIRILQSFRSLMQGKQLRKLSRAELEEFCLQKMCECVIDKSELATLRQKVKTLEQTVDSWRKEAVTVARQISDLKIVHERLGVEMRAIKENGKPLMPIKITRSVGLQAIMDVPNRKPANGIINNVVQQNQSGTNAAAMQRVQVHGNANVKTAVIKSVGNPSPVTTPNRQISQTQSRSPQIPRSSPTQAVNNGSKTPIPIAPKDKRILKIAPQNTPASKTIEQPKAVIDLTDEDEKASTTKNNQRVATTSVDSIVANVNNAMMIMPLTMLNTKLITTANNIGVPTSQVSIVTTQQMPKTVQQVRVPVTSLTSVRAVQPQQQKFKHPAPLPTPQPLQGRIVGRKPVPPKPLLNLNKSSCGTGIVLQWKMPYQLEHYETIVSYQLYAYQETKAPPSTDNWGKIGDVKALELPMAVTLTQFAAGNRYFFAVRAVDSMKRLGQFSDPQTILL